MAEFEVKQEDRVTTRPASAAPAGPAANLRAWFAKVNEEAKQKPKPAWLTDMEPHVEALDRKLGAGFWSVVGIVLAGFVFGTPHMLTTYNCSGTCGSSYAREFDCNYVGLTGGKRAPPVNDRCRVVRLL